MILRLKRGKQDDPSIHQAHQALTRLTGLSVNVLCLFGDDAHLYLDLKKTELLDTRLRPDKDLTKELLMRSVSVSKKGLVEKIIEVGQKVPPAWREEALLRHHYILCFDNLNRCDFSNHALWLDNERGLIVNKVS